MARTKQAVQRSLAVAHAATKGFAHKSATPPKPHRFRPGTVALREIKKMQKSVDNLIPRAPLMRLVREIVSMFTSNGCGLRITKGAFQALRDAAEDMLVDVFETSQVFALHRGCITILPKDMKLVIRECIDRMAEPGNKMSGPKMMVPH
jgi:histone H3